MTQENLILNVDSYKTSHFLQYPPQTEKVSCYIESRGGQFQQTLFFGLQMYIKNYLLKPITEQQIHQAKNIITAHGLPFNEAGWRHILDAHQGYLPIEIQALAEGSITPTNTAMLQIVNTDPQCFWLPSYLETSLLRGVWYPTTVATISWHCRQIIAKYLKETADNDQGLPFKLHDFGARGASSEETAAIGGAAHLINFMGTDTISGIIAAQQFYHADMAGFSIPSAEHGTITSWGKKQETDAYRHLLNQFAGPNKMIAVVSDSYDLYHAIQTIWGEDLAEQVKNNGGTVVIRPDSGDPLTIVIETIHTLMNKFGYQVNSKGFKVLPDFIRVIQGDGISRHSIAQILAEMKVQQLSADNIAFGMGAELLQKLNRDTLHFAMKTSAIRVNGKWRDVFKHPITDPNKKSKKGRLAVIKNKDNQYQTIQFEQLNEQENQLQPIFRNGELIKDHHFEEIRERSTCINQ